MPSIVDLCDTLCFNRSSESEEDWKAKYEEVYEMLAETEAELKEFQISSKELEDEMVLDVDRAEKAREEMEARLNRIEGEREDFKVRSYPHCCGFIFRIDVDAFWILPIALGM